MSEELPSDSPTTAPPPDQTARPANVVVKTRSPARTHRLSLKKKILFSAVITGFVMLSCEMLLALIGIQPRFSAEDPFVGFRPGSPLFIRRGEYLTTNPAKSWYFNMQTFPARKAAKAFRIFCLGGSTTYGHPYDDQTSYVGWLRARLQDADPDRDWQVINCGGISYASYRNCHLMQELAAYEPDLFVVFDGHNEFLEERTYGVIKHPGTLMLASEWLVARTRIGALVSRLVRHRTTARPATVLDQEVESILKSGVGPEQYHRDADWQQAVIEHFRISLGRDVQIARSAGARLMLVKPASNMRSFSPFKSESGRLAPKQAAEWQKLIEEGRALRSQHEFTAAARCFTAAAELDPLHALTHWEAGDALFHIGDVTAARRYFMRAIDEDICPLRATTPIVSIIEEAVRQHGIPLIDFEKRLADELERSAGPPIPGDESFLDHVHPIIDNNRLIAWGVFEELVKQRVVRDQPSDEALVQRISRNVQNGIDRQRQAVALINLSQVLVSAGKDEESLKLTERAEELHPGLPLVAAYRGRILEKLGRAHESFLWYSKAVDRDPQALMPLTRLAAASVARQDWEAARDYYERSLRVGSKTVPNTLQTEMHTGLGQAYSGLQRWTDAQRQFRLALSLSPQSVEASTGLADAVRQSSAAGKLPAGR